MVESRLFVQTLSLLPRPPPQSSPDCPVASRFRSLLCPRHWARAWGQGMSVLSSQPSRWWLWLVRKGRHSESCPGTRAPSALIGGPGGRGREDAVQRGRGRRQRRPDAGGWKVP